MLRSIRGIFPAAKVNMDGVFLDQALPIYDIDQIDPFLLIHHWDRPLPGKQLQKEVGVGPHPHRGFVPVTIIIQGSVHHRDSRGNSSIIGEGGAQWMHAGMGIIHSERPGLKLAEKGGPFEIVQFWVNLPANQKMSAPEYHPLTKESMPVFSGEDDKSKLRLISGEYGKLKGPVIGKTNLLIGIVEMQKGGRIELEIPESYNGMLYLLKGKLLLNSSFTLAPRSLAWFKNNGNKVIAEASEDCQALLLSGEPIGEEVTASGPFVMNKHSEILEAMRDYQMGKMGILIEEF